MTNLKAILVTGGAGYVGCVLVPKLLAAGYRVIVYDVLLFGSDGLSAYPNVRVIKGDLRDTADFRAAVEGCDAVIHLVSILVGSRRDFEQVMEQGTRSLVDAAKAAGVRRFIYASTSSVYGVSDDPNVTEEHPLVPLTDYNKYKGLCEPILLRYQSPEFTTVILRPATVCGYSPRMRFDLSVNILTNHAVNRGVITVFGGQQKRPNIHVEDIAELYQLMLELPDGLIGGEIFNAAYQNHTISELAEIARRVVEQEMPEKAPIRIETTPSNDPRSYHVSSRKIAEKLGYVPKRTIEDAVRDLCTAFKSGKLPNSLDNEQYFNVKTVRKVGLR